MKAYQITIQPGTYNAASIFSGNSFVDYMKPFAQEGILMKEWGKGKRATVSKEIVLTTKSESVRDNLCSQYGMNGTCVEIEIADQIPAANRATARQINYLIDLGYTGSGNITKAEASTLIDQLKGRRYSSNPNRVPTAADVDDFTGPEWTW